MSDTKTPLFKVGDCVAVCYDGKVGRAMRGEVIGVDAYKDEICIRFREWANENHPEIVHWFPRKRQSKNDGYPAGYGGFVSVENSLMKSLFGDAGDWYSIYSEKWFLERYNNDLIDQYVQAYFDSLPSSDGATNSLSSLVK